MELHRELHVQRRNELSLRSPGEVDVVRDAENTAASLVKSLKLIAPRYRG